MYVLEKSKSNADEKLSIKNPNKHPWSISEEKNKLDQSKNATNVEETDAISERTIHPKITPQKIANKKSIAAKLKERKFKCELRFFKFYQKKKNFFLNEFYLHNLLIYINSINKNNSYLCKYL